MRLYNVLTRQVEPFAPGAGRTVRLYVCGITPYDTTHMGHAMTYLTFDVLNRACQARGWRVKYVQNVTDIDDDILRRARQVDEDWEQLGDRHIRQFQEDLNALNVLPPAVYPRATEEVPTIVEMTRALIADGHAYERDGNIYFRISSDPDYGKLSHLDRETMLQIAAERGGRVDDPLKDDPLDFLLWQAAAPGEPTWPSPWGPGRPGWHIECSAMSMRYLGETIDVHGGGTDLIFPHHENEIAQSESYSGKPFVRYWMHVGMLRYQGEKMSKSLGNLVMAPQLLETYTPDAIRICLMSHRYRESWEYDDLAMSPAQQLADDLKAAANDASGGSGRAIDPGDARRRFEEALDDDLDTPAALEALRILMGDIRDGEERGYDIREAQAALRELTGVLGLTLA